MIFFSLIIIQGYAKEPPTLIQGYVYLDDELVIPEQVSLILSAEMINATIFNDGRYIITLTETEPGNTEKYLVIYNEKIYTPEETFTIQENIYMYNIDLHIQTTDDNNQSVNENIRPIARAGGPYTEIINVPIFFNASESYDLDGDIVNYHWNFGDTHTATGVNTEHTYSSIGKYKVTLTVTDNDGLTDSNITFAYITDTPNNPPDKPTITGIKKGTINTRYRFNITAFDLDNDTIKYSIDWNDITETTITEYLSNGTVITVNHTWTQPGEFILKANAEDEKNAVSETTEYIILIDSHYVKNLGYLVDYTNDGMYNTFYSNTTKNETLTKIQNGNYLIDSNNDGEYDQQYNIITDQLSSYQLETDLTEQETKKGIPLFILIYIILAAVIILSLIIGIYIIRKQKPKKEKVYYVQEPKEEIEVETEEEKIDYRKETVEDIEEQIDELLKDKKL